MKKTILPIFATFTWISLTLFLRNEVLLKDYWVSHYQDLGITFPSEPVNGMVWVIWSLLYAIAFYIFSRKYSLVNTALIAWFTGFLMMEIVVGNLGVLPFGILVYAIPMSLVEVFGASFIVHRLSGTAK
jgi:hypothetical protein